MTMEEIKLEEALLKRKLSLLADESVKACGVKIGDVIAGWDGNNRIVIDVVPCRAAPSRPIIRSARIKKDGTPSSRSAEDFYPVTIISKNKIGSSNV